MLRTVASKALKVREHTRAVAFQAAVFALGYSRQVRPYTPNVGLRLLWLKPLLVELATGC